MITILPMLYMSGLAGFAVWCGFITAPQAIWFALGVCAMGAYVEAKVILTAIKMKARIVAAIEEINSKRRGDDDAD